MSALPLETAFLHLLVSDELVAKAAGLSEVARIAKLEVRSRDYLIKTWRQQSATAVAAGVAAASKGKSASAVAKAVDKEMSKWAGGVVPTFNANVAKVYMLANAAGKKKANGEYKGSLQYDGPIPVAKARGRRGKAPAAVSSMALEDARALESLQGRNLFWIGEHYQGNVAPTIAQATSETMGAGASRRTAGEALRERLERELGEFSTPGGWRGTAAQYFDGVAANAMTVARVEGQVRAFSALGVEKYVIVNPLDERTCPVCGHMDGKVFKTSAAEAQLERESGATTPEDIKRIHPWLTAAQVRALSPTAGASPRRETNALARAGFALPPFHFRCRCTVDIEV